MNNLPYFAFGSNMSQEQLKERGVNWNACFSAFLKNYSLFFNKVASYGNKSFANIEPSLNNEVHGILYYGLTEEDLNILDIYEGASRRSLSKKSS